MAADHRVRLAHHLISTSIVKQLRCQFSGSLPLYRFRNESSSVSTTLFRRPAPSQIQRISRQIHAEKAYYKFATLTSTPRPLICQHSRNSCSSPNGVSATDNFFGYRRHAAVNTNRHYPCAGHGDTVTRSKPWDMETRLIQLCAVLPFLPTNRCSSVLP